MRVLVTGHRGYLGSVVCTVLEHARFNVVGLDSDLYRDCAFGRTSVDVPSHDFDLRDVEFADLIPFDAVVHLAALSDDACGELNPHLTDAINHQATVRLAECCKRAGVARFVFASTCAVYGRAGCEFLTEESPVRPMTAYAASKLRCERDLAAMSDAAFSPIVLRLGTGYGVSPRMRVDLVVNEFVASAVTGGRVVMRSTGSAWRPLVHVEDVARLIAAVLIAPPEHVNGQTFNVVRREENYRVIDIADQVCDLFAPCPRVIGRDVFDERSYRVDGGKLQRTFPQFRFRWTLPLGIGQLRHALLSAGFTPGDWRCDRYRRALRLQSLLEHGHLDHTLRPARVLVA